MKENGKRHFTAENVCMNKIWKREWPATKEDQRLIALMQYSSEYQSKSKKLANEVKSKRFSIRVVSWKFYARREKERTGEQAQAHKYLTSRNI